MKKNYTIFVALLVTAIVSTAFINKAKNTETKQAPTVVTMDTLKATPVDSGVVDTTAKTDSAVVDTVAEADSTNVSDTTK